MNKTYKAMLILALCAAGIFYLHAQLEEPLDITPSIERAKRLSSEGLHKEANEILAKLSGEGDIDATAHLAGSYLGGFGVKKDIEKAMILARPAALAGSVDAQILVFLIYAKGLGSFEIDLNRAKCWILPSANYGDPLSQNYLYDITGELEWLLRSARQGYEPAMKQLADSAPVDGSVNEASTFLIIMAEQGDKSARKRLSGIISGQESEMGKLLSSHSADPERFWKAEPEDQKGPPPQGEVFQRCGS